LYFFGCGGKTEEKRKAARVLRIPSYRAKKRKKPTTEKNGHILLWIMVSKNKKNRRGICHFFITDWSGERGKEQINQTRLDYSSWGRSARTQVT